MRRDNLDDWEIPDTPFSVYQNINAFGQLGVLKNFNVNVTRSADAQ